MKKTELRKIYKTKRKLLDIKSLSLELCTKLSSTKEYMSAKHIMIYYPLEDEINLLTLMEDNSKSFYLPKIVGNNLICCPYRKGDNLTESKFHTLEPNTTQIDANKLDLVIIPALACDKSKCRLGYGGGFYDRFLKTTNAKKIVCISQSQITETIFPNEYDVPVDIIITEENNYN